MCMTPHADGHDAVPCGHAEEVKGGGACCLAFAFPFGQLPARSPLPSLPTRNLPPLPPLQACVPSLQRQPTEFNLAVLSRCPALMEVYRPVPLFTNCHVETILASLYRYMRDQPLGVRALRFCLGVRAPLPHQPGGACPPLQPGCACPPASGPHGHMSVCQPPTLCVRFLHVSCGSLTGHSTPDSVPPPPPVDAPRLHPHHVPS